MLLLQFDLTVLPGILAQITEPAVNSLKGKENESTSLLNLSSSSLQGSQCESRDTSMGLRIPATNLHFLHRTHSIQVPEETIVNGLGDKSPICVLTSPPLPN